MNIFGTKSRQSSKSEYLILIKTIIGFRKTKFSIQPYGESPSKLY